MVDVILIVGCLTGAAVICASLLIWFIQKIRCPEEFKLLNGPPQTSFLFGNMLEMRGSFEGWKNNGNFPEPLLSWMNKYGNVVYIREITNHSLVIMDPKAIQHVLVSNASNYPRETILSNYLQEVLFGTGLLSSHGTQHDQFRKMLNPIFTSEKIKTFVAMFELHARRCCDDVLAKAVESHSPIDIQTVLKLLTLEIIGLVAFGYNFTDNTTGYAAYQEYLEELNPILFIGLFLWPKFTSRLPIPSLQRRRKAHLKLKQIMQDVIDQKLNQPLMNDSPKDLLDLILPHSTKDEALVHTMTFMTGGHDTTSSTLAWVFQAIAERPQLAQAIREEYFSVVEKYGSLSSWEAVSELKFTNAVILETLRLNSVAFILIRTALEDDILPTLDGSKLRVPKGTGVNLCTAAMNYSSQFWNEPHSFIPERFIEGTLAWNEDASLRQGLNQKNYFFPFSTGSKSCIGQKFAMAEMQVIVSVFISHFEFETASNSDFRHKFNGLTVQPTKFSVHVKAAPQGA